MAPIWDEIGLLIFEARMMLTRHGYTNNQGTDAMYDPEDFDEKTESIIGAKVFAFDDNGNRGEELVWYPDDWFERAYPNETKKT